MWFHLCLKRNKMKYSSNQFKLLAVLCLCFLSCAVGQYNPDDLAKIERPCPTYDLNCIRAFFQKHAHCKKTFGPVPDPVSRPQANLFLSRVNISVAIDEQKVGGLNGRVEEFYINRETDNLIIAVEFRNMSQTSNYTHFIIHRRAKEPVVVVAFATVTYDSVTITAIIPRIDDLQLQDAECTTFSNDNTSRFFISPTAAESDDPQVQESLAAFFTNLPVNIQEFFLTDSAYFIATYIQYNICDFGLFLT